MRVYHKESCKCPIGRLATCMWGRHLGCTPRVTCVPVSSRFREQQERNTNFYFVTSLTHLSLLFSSPSLSVVSSLGSYQLILASLPVFISSPSLSCCLWFRQGNPCSCPQLFLGSGCLLGRHGM